MASIPVKQVFLQNEYLKLFDTLFSQGILPVLNLSLSLILIRNISCAADLNADRLHAISK